MKTKLSILAVAGLSFLGLSGQAAAADRAPGAGGADELKESGRTGWIPPVRTPTAVTGVRG